MNSYYSRKIKIMKSAKSISIFKKLLVFGEFAIYCNWFFLEVVGNKLTGLMEPWRKRDKVAMS
jgi:hypothetical protein